MGKGLWRSHHAEQTIAARRDYERLFAWCEANGHMLTAARCTVKQTAGWRKLDQTTKKLRRLLGAVPDGPWGDDVLAGLPAPKQTGGAA